MTLAKKLGLCFAATSALTAILGVSAWLGISAVTRELDESVHLVAKKVALANDLKYSLLTMRFSDRGILLFASNNGEEKKNLNVQLLDATERRFTDDAGQMRPLLTTAKEQDLLDQALASIQLWEQAQTTEYTMVSATKYSEAIQYDMANLVAPGTTALAALQQLGDMQQGYYDQAVAHADSVASTSRILVITLLTLSICLGLIAGTVLRQSTHTLIQIAEEMGRGADQVAASAGQVSLSSQTLASGSSQQAAAIEETSASSEQINAMARKNAACSHTMATLVEQSQQMHQQANRELDEMVHSMDEINQSSGKISKIIKVIDEIAFQTNILALNAAVEAARAGEAGMGFAVVAEEVRNLAQRSAQAAQDTASLIAESIDRSNGGKAKVDQMAIAIRAITADSGKIKTLVDEVTQGSEEQSKGLDQIARAIGQMEQVTQSTAASAEQSAAAAEQLNAQSESMKEAVAQMNAMVVGRGAHSSEADSGRGIQLKLHPHALLG
jgi:methyl-accepting chemotaxis protein/methyl-accepting chemotaxis protein-1 (serine sensor receptor)